MPVAPSRFLKMQDGVSILSAMGAKSPKLRVRICASMNSTSSPTVVNCPLQSSLVYLTEDTATLLVAGGTFGFAPTLKAAGDVTLAVAVHTCCVGGCNTRETQIAKRKTKILLNRVLFPQPLQDTFRHHWWPTQG